MTSEYVASGEAAVLITRMGAIERRLLAERAALCWHIVHLYERTYAQAGDLSIRQAEFHQRRIDAAHRRYLQALRTLASVRKLAVPAIQANIAKKQVNVAGGPAAVPPGLAPEEGPR